MWKTHSVQIWIKPQTDACVCVLRSCVHRGLLSFNHHLKLRKKCRGWSLFECYNSVDSVLSHLLSCIFEVSFEMKLTADFELLILSIGIPLNHILALTSSPTLKKKTKKKTYCFFGLRLSDSRLLFRQHFSPTMILHILRNAVQALPMI